MPIPTLGAINGDDIQGLIESLEKQRKELDFILNSLDTTNVVELSADVINAGLLNANLVQIRTDLTGGAYITIDGSGLYANDGTKDTFYIGSDGDAVFSGRIIGGSIESDTFISVTTDLYVGNNIYLKQDWDTRFDEKVLFFSDDNGGTFDTKISGTYLVMSMEANTIRLRGKSQIDIQAPSVFFSSGSTVDFNSVTVEGLSGYSPIDHTHSEYSISGHVHSGSSYVKPSSGQAITLGAGGSTLNVYVDGSLIGTIAYD